MIGGSGRFRGSSSLSLTQSRVNEQPKLASLVFLDELTTGRPSRKGKRKIDPEGYGSGFRGTGDARRVVAGSLSLIGYICVEIFRRNAIRGPFKAPSSPESFFRSCPVFVVVVSPAVCNCEPVCLSEPLQHNMNPILLLKDEEGRSEAPTSAQSIS